MIKDKDDDNQLSETVQDNSVLPLSPKTQNENRQLDLFIKTKITSGPLPNPEVLAEYKKVDQKILDAILKRFNWQGFSGIIMNLLGLLVPSFILLVIVYLSYDLIKGGHWEGSVTIAISLAGLVGWLYKLLQRK